MASRVGIWALREGLPRRAERSKVALEMDLEDWCTHDPGLLYEGLKVVGRQVHCDGGYIDLLGLDVQGRWVVVELKRERLYREAVIQAIDYASSIRHMETDRLEQAIEKTVGVLADPETARQRVRFQLDAEGEEREVTIVVAGTGVDPGLERVVDFLSGFDIPLRIVTFEVFEAPGGGQLLVRDVLDEEGAEVPPGKKTIVRTVERIRGVAAEAGVSDAFDAIVAAAQGANLFCRAHIHTVTITPESHRGRHLMSLTPEIGKGLRYTYGAESFAEFFDMEAQDVELRLGPDGLEDEGLIAPDSWQDRTAELVDFLTELPVTDARDEDRRADFETVNRLAQLVRPGEWTTYGELSKAAIGRSSAAMAIGNMARSNTGFANPHRVLDRSGHIAEGWLSDEGEGPEACRRQLEDENLEFDSSGAASEAAFICAEELNRRDGEGHPPHGQSRQPRG